MRVRILTVATAAGALMTMGLLASPGAQGAAVVPDPCDLPVNVIEGGPAADDLVGTNRRDLILGHGGSDYIRGSGCADVLIGGEGADWLAGQDGDDALFGGDGADLLVGGAGTNGIYGGPDSDECSDDQNPGPSIWYFVMGGPTYPC
jgi:Ca2+-binding RTX toxin-like protein